MLLNVVCLLIERSVFLRQLFKHDGNRCSEDRGIASELPAGRQGISGMVASTNFGSDPGVPAEQSAGVPSAEGSADRAIIPATVAVVVEMVATPPDTFPVWE